MCMFREEADAPAHRGEGVTTVAEPGHREPPGGGEAPGHRSQVAVPDQLCGGLQVLS